jgi:hypothetical protein
MKVKKRGKKDKIRKRKPKIFNRKESKGEKIAKIKKIKVYQRKARANKKPWYSFLGIGKK